MIEAEVKYRVGDRPALTEALSRFGRSRRLIYNDQYFSHSSPEIMPPDAEARVRWISAEDEKDETVLTYKKGIVDPATESKHEYEISVSSDQSHARAFLEAMGFECYIEFRKICEHFTFETDGKAIAATIVTLEEAPGTFVEIESLVEDDDAAVAERLDWLSRFAESLGLDHADKTTETYEGAVARARGGKGGRAER